MASFRRPDRLVITADDFGISAEVNEAVEIAHRNGVLSAASLMVGGVAADDAVRRARRMPRLRVGLHLALVDAVPISPPAQLGRLVDGAGRLRSDLAGLGRDLALSREARTQLTREIDAQFAAFAATGLVLDHVNAHEHYYLHPLVGRIAVDGFRRRGVRAMRVPREDVRLLRRLDPSGVLRNGLVEDLLSAGLRRRARAAAIVAPDHCFGLRWSGAMHSDRLAALLSALPRGLVEIYLHPATGGGFEGSAPGYAYRAELDALLDPRCADALKADGRPVGGYADAVAP